MTGKNLKEQQRERQIKQQKMQEAHERENKQNRTRKHSKRHSIKYVFSAICLIALLLTAYGVWQYYEGQKPPTIGTVSGSPSATSDPSVSLAPNFSLKDINGTQISLSSFNGKVLGIHFMAVGCHGQINPNNEYQLAQLNSACKSLCVKGNAAFVTIVVSTCQTSDLNLLRSNYGVTWAMGNDYADGTLEIVDNYVPFGIGDGAVILVDKTSNIVQIYNNGVSANTLVSRVNQLSGA
jgi:hypothetical protein